MSEAKKKTKKAPAPYLRASGWKTWQQCALSLIIKDETPFPPEQDEFASEGTKIHAAIEAELKGGARERLDIEQEAIVDFAVRVTRSEAGENAFKVESYHEQKTGQVKQAARIDVEIDEPDTITILDFKTGWKMVEAQNEVNGKTIPDTQLKMGAHLGHKRHHKFWRGIIINARLNHISMTGPHPIEKNYLKELAADAVKRVAAVQTQVGNHCAFCPALARCKPVRAAIQKWLVPGADDGIKNRKDDWAECLSLAKPAEKLFDRIKSDAMKYVELGGEIPGVSIEMSGGSRAWPRDLMLPELAAKLGVAREKMYEEKIISPAEAEKRGVPREKIQAVAIQPMRRALRVGKT